MAQRSPVVLITGEDIGGATPADEAGTSPQMLAEPEVDARDRIQKTREAVESGMASARESLHSAQRKLSDSTATAMRRFHEFAEERPLHLLAIVAGAAFVAGVVLRAWRSSRYE